MSLESLFSEMKGMVKWLRSDYLGNLLKVIIKTKTKLFIILQISYHVTWSRLMVATHHVPTFTFTTTVIQP